MTGPGFILVERAENKGVIALNRSLVVYVDPKERILYLDKTLLSRLDTVKLSAANDLKVLFPETPVQTAFAAAASSPGLRGRFLTFPPEKGKPALRINADAVCKLDPWLLENRIVGTIINMGWNRVQIHEPKTTLMPGEVRTRLGIPEPSENKPSDFLAVPPASGKMSRAVFYNMANALTIEPSDHGRRTQIVFMGGLFTASNTLNDVKVDIPMAKVLRAVGVDVPRVLGHYFLPPKDPAVDAEMILPKIF